MPNPSEPSFDEAKFSPHPAVRSVRPTATSGAFHIPPPPPGFDARSATAEEFQRTGMLWRRSVANRNPIVRSLWDRATARGYRPADPTATGFGPPPNC